MTQRNLDLSQISTYSNWFLSANLFPYSWATEAFNVLFCCGCRVEELFEIDRWTWIDGYELEMQPQKGNNVRPVTLNSSCASFIEAVKGQYAPFLGNTSNKLEYVFNKFRPFGQLSTGGSYVSLYLFRYRFVKQMYADGHTIAEIASEMGYTSTTTPAAYLDAVLVETYSLPSESFVTIGNIDWMDADINYDDAGGGVIYPNIDYQYSKDFGLLYTFDAAARIASLFPGWRIPTQSDWLVLYNCAYAAFDHSLSLRDPSSYYWDNSVSVGSNVSGFSARAAGYVANSGVPDKFRKTWVCWTTAVYNSLNHWCIFINYNGTYLVHGYALNTSYRSLRLCRDHV
jgi:uncharacterized protein (TIGR02145 family)